MVGTLAGDVCGRGRPLNGFEAFGQAEQVLKF